MKDMEEPLGTLENEANSQEDKGEEKELTEDKHTTFLSRQSSSLYSVPELSESDGMKLLLSGSIFLDRIRGYYLSSSPQRSGMSISSEEPRTSKSTDMTCSRADKDMGMRNYLSPETDVNGEGEDYFLSLFGDSKKVSAQSIQCQDPSKQLSMMLEEVGRSTSSSLDEIKIEEVNIRGLFVRIVNSSFDKELQIGDYTLLQNMNGESISSYKFLPNISLPANSTVTVWAAASKAKHQPPSDFFWKEQNKFKSSPDCTTILCNSKGEAVAWYTPIHWMQAWEKVETDIEFDRYTVSTPTSKPHIFWRTTSENTENRDYEDESEKNATEYHMETTQLFLRREKEIPPILVPNHSPWCSSPDVPPHPYCPLIESCHLSCGRREPRSQATRTDPALGTKGKKKSKSQKGIVNKPNLSKDNSPKVTEMLSSKFLAFPVLVCQFRPSGVIIQLYGTVNTPVAYTPHHSVERLHFENAKSLSEFLHRGA
ncbi:PREDICTED: lamin tail domain-containing protein 1 [Dipodomys ordii]|uniref:Lamin tail domain-containing protein 1 n=1 Tax=Dipodomys ordii TaxID=10020 RepID=A0A1S3FV73_DIPOR|nr:PREDICTED: lamin tail domain-containing protein 1 [Dipodomys ordii]